MKMLQSLVPLIALMIFTGCATLETNAYRIIGSAAVLVDGAMNGWGDYVRAGKASATEETQVKATYEKYQVAMRAARAVVGQYRAGASDGDALNQALDILDASKNQLITLITALTHKSP